MFSAALGSRLRKLRTGAGLTQQQLAAPRYTAAYVSTIEAGKRRPSRDAIEYFAGRLNIDPEELITGRSKDLVVQLQGQILEARRMASAGDRPGADRLLKDVQGRARRAKLPLLLGKAIEAQAFVAERSGRLDDAQMLYREAIGELRHETPLARVETVSGLARVHHAKNEIHYAIYLVETLLIELSHRGLEDPGSVVRLKTSLVATYFDAKLPREAARAAEEALALSPQVDDPERLANMHINVARILLDEGRFDEAREAYHKAEELFMQMELPTEVARVHLARGFALLEEGDLGAARRHLEQARELFERTGDPIGAARTSLQLGRLLRLEEALDDARFLLGTVTNASAEGIDVERGMAWRELAQCDLAAGRRDLAAGHLDKAIAILAGTDDLREIAVTFRILGDLRRDEDEFEAACDAYRRAAIGLEQTA